MHTQVRNLPELIAEFTPAAVCITDPGAAAAAGELAGTRVFTGPDAFVEVKVVQGSTLETLSPRQRITAAPFALQAEGTMPASAVILGKTANSSILLNSGFQMTGRQRQGSG